MKNTNLGKTICMILSVLLCVLVLAMFGCCCSPYYTISEPYHYVLNPNPMPSHYTLMDVMWMDTKVVTTYFTDMYSNFNINDYVNTTFRMYNSERVEVELICDNDVMDAIIDRFGEDVTTYANDMTSFRVVVNVATSHIFYSWVFGFCGKVKIKSPAEIKEKFDNHPAELPYCKTLDNYVE